MVVGRFESTGHKNGRDLGPLATRDDLRPSVDGFHNSALYHAQCATMDKNRLALKA
jgi:hypothetical protein